MFRKDTLSAFPEENSKRPVINQTYYKKYGSISGMRSCD